MKTNRTQPTERLLAAQDARLLDMFDGALPPDPPEPPEPTAPAAHDFLVFCWRADAPAPQPAPVALRSAA